MIVTEKNIGRYVAFALDGTRISLSDGALTLDLSAFERDYPVHLDISADETGALVLGPSRRYVAELDIPARMVAIIPGDADDFGFPKLRKVPEPLDTDSIKLTLWALEV